MTASPSSKTGTSSSSARTHELVARNGRYAALYATWLAHMTGASTNGSH